MVRIRTDWTLFLTIVVMVCFGLVMVYSSSSVVAEFKLKSGTHFVRLQLGWALFSLLVLMFIKAKDYRALRSSAWAYGPLSAVFVLLIVVFFADPRTHRWLRLGIGSLQPSEFAKPALILFLAYFVARRVSNINNNRYTLAPVAMVVTALAIAVGIGDLGTAVVLIVTAGAVFYVAGLDRRYCTMATVAMVLFVLVSIVTKGYRLGRVWAFFDPEYKVLDTIDPQGRVKNYIHSGSTVRDPDYQVRQAKIAMGSGGVLGLGVMQGKQKLFYLPEPHNDFIFAVVGEELGLRGTLAVLAGFFVVMWRGVRLFWLAPDDFGRYLALGVTVSIVAQALINMSVVTALAPTKGIPLPMISYGGSSLLSTLTMLGILLNVSEHAG